VDPDFDAVHTALALNGAFPAGVLAEAEAAEARGHGVDRVDATDVALVTIADGALSPAT
jgi:hypothetical protein